MTTVKKLAIGFGLFFGYYLLARVIENKVALVQKITNIGSNS